MQPEPQPQIQPHPQHPLPKTDVMPPRPQTATPVSQPHMEHFAHNPVTPSRPQVATPTAAPAHPQAEHAIPPGAHPQQPDKKQQAQAAKQAKSQKKVKKSLSRSAASRDAKEYFVENLSMLLSTEVTVGDAIATISKEMPSKKVKKALEEMVAKIDEGMPFWKALDETGLLTNSAIALIKIGEESGRLPDNLKVVAEQMHKTNMLAAKIKSAMLYPAFLIGLLFVVGSGVGLFLLPRLADIFKGLNAKLGLMTRVLISFGTFWGKWGILITAAGVVFVIILVFIIRSSKPLRSASEHILFIIPGVKPLLFESEIARFGFILGSLLNAGLPVTDALGSLADSMATKRYRDVAAYIKVSVEQGNSFAKALDGMKHKEYIPGPIRQLIVSAEKTGTLADTLIKAGAIYEDKADITARNLETLLEPIILVIIAVAVLMVALAVILPIYSLVGGLNSK